MSDEEETGQIIDLAQRQADKALAIVEDRLPRDAAGRPLPIVANALWLMARVPSLQDLLKFNEFTDEYVLTRAPPAIEDTEPLPGPYPRPWDQHDVLMLQSYFQRRWKAKWGREAIEGAMVVTAAQHRFHPVRDYLDSLRWDGRPRLDRWLVSAFGVPDDAYHRAIGAKALIAAVRRVREPGCKFDYVLTIEGPQGRGKSTALHRLFGEGFYSDSLHTSLGDRDAAMSLIGAWGLEIAEIEKIIVNEPATVKAFLSRQTDRFRPPYGKRYVTRPRQGILVGTTNESEWLRDPSGNRRFWPARGTHADPDWTEANRDQLWAEASMRAAAGEAIWLDDETVAEEAMAQQAARLDEDPWRDAITGWLIGRPWLRINDLLRECLQLPLDRQTKAAQMRAAGILRSLGWSRQLRRVAPDINPVRAWFPPNYLEPPG